MGTSKGIKIADKGQMGDFTVYQRNGRTVVRQKQQRINHSLRTPGRMGQRTKWVNVVGSWKSFCGDLKGNFEVKNGGQTDYNAYMSINLNNSQVRFTREEAEWGACVADHYCVSRGNLQPSIVLERQGDIWLSDIAVGEIKPMMDAPQVGDLVAALFRGNPGRFQRGDELQVIRMWQTLFGENEIPKVETECQLFTLDSMDERPLGEVLCEECLMVSDGRLALQAEERMMVAMVLRRRKRDGTLQVTTQNLVGENDLLARYTSKEAAERAIKSYDVKGNRVKSRF